VEQLNVLIVDDDVILGPVVKDYLESRDMLVTLVQDSTRALITVKENEYDVCILDVKMPGKTGFELAAEIQDILPSLPFIFLTGESGKSQKLEGLRMGADDYITKPFNIEELYLRICVVVRRMKRADKLPDLLPAYTIGRYSFNPHLRTLSFRAATRQLSAIETQLLLMFCQSHNGIIERETALKKIWKDEYMFRGRSLNVYVSKLREYLQEDKNIDILNIHGRGYSLVVK
jgi:two-component system OmpR family response regulator